MHSTELTPIEPGDAWKGLHYIRSATKNAKPKNRAVDIDVLMEGGLSEEQAHLIIERRMKVLDCHKAKMNIRQTSDHLGISYWTTRDDFKRMGLRPTSNKRKKGERKKEMAEK